MPANTRTAEEIDRLRAGGKEVAVLLNKVHRQPLSGTALEEKARLDHYIEKIGEQAFIGEYDSDHRLAEVVSTLLTRIANKYRRDLDRSTQSRGVRPGEPDEEPEDVGKGVWPRIEAKDSVEADSRGQLRTQHKWQLVLESNMDQPVTNVNFRYEDGQGNPLENFDLRADRHEPTAILPPRGAVSYPLFQVWGSPNSALCVVQWTDSCGVTQETRATVRTI